MKILLLHNRYQQRGGEDVCVDAHRDLLRARGHSVRLLEAFNHGIHGWGMRARTAIAAVYSRDWKRRVAQEIEDFRPDVAHVHNTFPLLTPSVLLSCREAGVPVVQTFHNYRLGCPNGLLYRAGRVCEECLRRKIAWPGVAHACYRDSRWGTAAVAGAYAAHRFLRTYSDAMNVGIALSEFARRRLMVAGVPLDKLLVVPNWLEPDPGPGPGDGAYFLFLGRLSEEKGIATLLRAWRQIGGCARLLVAGLGPLEPELRKAPPGVVWLGPRTHPESLQLLRRASALILPSECYENSPRALVEAFAAATPVIASRVGSLAEIVQNGHTGLLFPPREADALARAVLWFLQHPAEGAAMRRAARAEYQTRYSGERVYPLLLRAYEKAMAGRGAPAFRSCGRAALPPTS